VTTPKNWEEARRLLDEQERIRNIEASTDNVKERLKRRQPRYLGEFAVDIEQSPFAGWTTGQWALHYIGLYGGIDGDHHKAWVLDQVARILNGAPLNVVEAKWDNGDSEFRFDVGDSETYRQWVVTLRAGENGPDSYDYSEGIAP
jgi:hypothetical protein